MSAREDIVERVRSITKLANGARELFDIVSSGKVKVRIGQSYGLAEAARAHQKLEGRRTTGSSLLIP